jgi:phosphoribosylamine--glycine ligase
MKKRGTPYKGVLYLGLMITPKDEIYLLEINCRLGDPEAQVLLERFENGVFFGFVQWSLGLGPKPTVALKDLKAVYVVVAAVGYPGEYEKGNLVRGVRHAQAYARIIHAGTEHNDQGNLIATGGRVLGALALAKTFSVAKIACDTAAGIIINSSDGNFRARTDIATRIP